MSDAFIPREKMDGKLFKKLMPMSAREKTRWGIMRRIIDRELAPIGVDVKGLKDELDFLCSELWRETRRQS